MRRSTASPIALLVVFLAAAASGGCGQGPEITAVRVSGTTTGLTGTVILKNDGFDPLTITENGPFTFASPIAAGRAYAVTVDTQPAGQTCTVTNGSSIAGSANVTDVAVTCVTNTETLGGTVSGLAGSLVLQANGSDSLTITANGAFAFQTSVADESAYVVKITAQPANQTCMLADASGVVGTADITDIGVTCFTNAFTVGGAVSGLAGTVVLRSGADTLSIGTDGAFMFPTPVAEGSRYQVTVKTQPATETCSVTNASAVMGAVRVTNVAVVCAVNAFSAGGTVSGLAGTVVLQDNGGDSLTLGADGPFTFATPVAEGGTYSATVQTQPAAQTCTVSNGSGTMGGSNVTNIAVTCSQNAYTVGGAVSGLNGTVVLQNDGADNDTITSNGSFTFLTPVAEGSPYNVTVQTQPAAQTCTVTNGSGIMGAANVTNAVLSCVTNTTTLTVSATGTIPVNGSSGSITITNTGASTALNVSAVLPGGWSGVTQDSSGCAALAPTDSCVLTFTSTTPYVAEGNITITGDNVPSGPTTALAFTIDGYLVYSVPTGSTALVLASSDASSSVRWSTTSANISGITQTSTAPPSACNGATDGACDTDQIVAFYGAPSSNFAAGLCDEITSDNTGAVAIGTWYLPSICQLAGAGQGAGCSSGLADIDTNLVQLGFGGLSGYHWSSTEYAAVPSAGAWMQYFETGGNSVQIGTAKSGSFGARCVRSMTY